MYTTPLLLRPRAPSASSFPDFEVLKNFYKNQDIEEFRNTLSKKNIAPALLSSLAVDAKKEWSSLKHSEPKTTFQGSALQALIAHPDMPPPTLKWMADEAVREKKLPQEVWLPLIERLAGDRERLDGLMDLALEKQRIDLIKPLLQSGADPQRESLCLSLEDHPELAFLQKYASRTSHHYTPGVPASTASRRLSQMGRRMKDSDLDQALRDWKIEDARHLLSEKCKVDLEVSANVQNAWEKALEQKKFDIIRALILLGHVDSEQNDWKKGAMLLRVVEHATPALFESMLKSTFEAPKIVIAKIGRAAVAHAADSQRPDILKVLLQHGADPNMRVGLAPIQYLANKRNLSSNGKRALLMLLQRQDLDPNVQDHRGWTPLRCALHWHDKETVEAMLNHPAIAPNLTDQFGETYFTYMVKYLNHRTEIIDLLLHNEKVDVNKPGRDGLTALTLAIRLGDDKTMAQLLACTRIDPNARNADAYSLTPLHYAAEQPTSPHALRALLAHRDIHPKYAAQKALQLCIMLWRTN